VDRLAQLADDLLLIARYERGRLPLRVESLEADELLASVVTRFQWRADETSRPLASEAPSGLRVRGDRLRLEQALGNLVDNALRYGAGRVTLGAAGIDGRVVAFEVDVEPMVAESRIPRAQPLPRFPRVQRDLAVIVDETVAAGVLHTAIKEVAGDLLEHVRAFDEYRGAQVSEGHKSVAFTLTFRSPERTLTDAEVDKVMAEIKLGLEKRHRARFRE